MVTVRRLSAIFHPTEVSVRRRGRNGKAVVMATVDLSMLANSAGGHRLETRVKKK